MSLSLQQYWPVGAIGLVALVAAASLFDGGRFGYHPAFFLIGVLGLSLNATVVVKITRKFQIHSYMQLAALACMFGGFYAIYSNKDIAGKPHFWTAEASWHARFGFLAFLAFLANVAYSFYKGIRNIKGNRATHRLVGQWILRALCVVMLMGYFNLLGLLTSWAGLVLLTISIVLALVYAERLPVTLPIRTRLGQADLPQTPAEADNLLFSQADAEVVAA